MKKDKKKEKQTDNSLWSPWKQDLMTSDLLGVGVPEALDVDVVLAERWEVQEGEGRGEV